MLNKRQRVILQERVKFNFYNPTFRSENIVTIRILSNHSEFQISPEEYIRPYKK